MDINHHANYSYLGKGCHWKCLSLHSNAERQYIGRSEEILSSIMQAC